MCSPNAKMGESELLSQAPLHWASSQVIGHVRNSNTIEGSGLMASQVKLITLSAPEGRLRERERRASKKTNPMSLLARNKL